MPLRIDPTNLLGLERTIERCQVTSIPAGATPKFIKCRLPGGDGPITDAWWSGFPSLAVNDYVALRRSGGGHSAQYVVAGASGGTAATSGGGWPFDNVFTVSATNSNADYASLAAMLAGVSAGAVVLLDNETYTLTANFDINKAITIIGHYLGSTINTSTNSLTLLTLSAAVKLVNINITNSGAGTGGAGIFWTASGAVLDGCTVTVSGAGTANYGIGPSGAVTGTVKDCTITVSGGTSNYGLAAVTGNSTTTITNSRISGTTFDVYGLAAGAAATLNNCVLVNGTTNFPGILNWTPEAKIVKNLLADSLTYGGISWQTGTAFNDFTDDTYGPTLWNMLHNGVAPDVSQVVPGGTEPYTAYFKCVGDAANWQAGIVQFFENEDTLPLRGQTVSLSFDAWGTAIVELRAAVLYWTSTADVITSDVVGTWSTNNPTLAANWAYANTPGADITITTGRLRYAVNNITIPTTANNLAVFIWTSAEEASTDEFYLTRVQLERGPVATEFVARPFQQELGLVHRLFEKSYNLATNPATATNIGAFQIQIQSAGTSYFTYTPFFKVWKRTAPTITAYDFNGNANKASYTSAGVTTHNLPVTIDSQSQNGFRAYTDNTTSKDGFGFQYVADARL